MCIPQPSLHGGVERYPVNLQKDLSRPRLEVEWHHLFVKGCGCNVHIGMLSKYDSCVVFWELDLGHG
jgi:hypothetical protein